MNSKGHLTALPFDLHLDIFSNLQPYDILQIGQTCQTLYHASSERTVWTDALHRICVENTLFEPSFPVANMSVQELQRASMGPHRWIAKSSSKERNSDDVLPHVVTRHSISAMSDLDIEGHYLEQIQYLVPGGRYLFSIFWDEWLILWDLGSPYSSRRKPHSIAAVPINYIVSECQVHSTRDGMGLIVFLLCPDPTSYNRDVFTSFYAYEIYPESTTPQFTQIAYTRTPYSRRDTFCFLSYYDHLIFTHLNVLTVWDYRANTWARWSVEDECSKIIATKSAVVLIRTYGVSVWEIPPLLPESSLSMSIDPPPIMSAVFDLHYPGGYQYPHIHRYLHQAPCGWYSGTPHPLYFDVEEVERPESIAGPPRMIHRYEVVINSKTSDGTLNLLKTFEVPSTEDCSFLRNARICQNKTVSLCIEFGSDLLRTHVTDIYNRQLRSFLIPLCNYDETARLDDMTFCPATCRVVYRAPDEDSDEDSTINILDF